MQPSCTIPSFKSNWQNYPVTSGLKIATIYSFGINEDIDGVLSEEDTDNTDKLDVCSREFFR